MSTLFQLATRSLCISNRCLSPRLVNTERVCQPSLEPNRPCPGKGSVPTSQDTCSSSSTSMESTKVPNPFGNADRLFVPTTAAGNHSTPTSTGTPTSHVERPRKGFRNQNLSDQATELLHKSWSSKTNSSYNSLFGHWHHWYNPNGSD